MKAPRPFSFTGRDGVVISGEALGPADGLPVVLSHGGGQTRHAWGRCADLLAEHGFLALSLDLRGHGDSGWASDGLYSVDDYADDLRRLADDLQRGPILVGASLGGIASLIAAGEAPAIDIAGLALVDVSPHLRSDGVAGILQFMRSGTHGFESLQAAKDAVAAYLPHRPRPRNASGLERNLRLRPDGRYYWHWDPNTISKPLDPATMNMRVEAAAETLRAPALLLRGEFSELVSQEVAAAFMRRFADGRSLDVAGARHMVAGDSNDLFNQALLQFAAEIRDQERPGGMAKRT